MAITGIAISAAPLVLPPLVVFSAMGIAFSIPSGFVFATYACTNKLMTTLLPTPPSPIIMEYYSDEDEKAKNEGVQCQLELNDSGNGYRQMDELEKGYNLNEYDNDELGIGNVTQVEDEEGRRVIGLEVEVSVMNAGGDIDEKGYYTDEEEKEGEDEDQFRPVNVVEDEDGEQMEEINQGGDIVFELDDAGDDYREERQALVTNVDENVNENNYDINEYEEEKQRDDGLLQTGTVIEDEEREQMEDIKQGVVMSLGLDVGSNTNFGGSVDEQGCEEDVGEYLEGDDSLRKEHKEEESLLESRLDENGTNTRDENGTNTREGDDDSLEEEHKREESLLESRHDKNENFTREVTEDNKEEIVEGGTEMLEKVRDDGRVDDYFLDESASNVLYEAVKDVETTEPITIRSAEDNTIEDDYFLDGSASNVVSEEIKDVKIAEPVTVNEGSVEDNIIEVDYFLEESVSDVVLEEDKDVETTEPIMVREIETQKPVKDGSKNNEPIVEMHHVVILSAGNKGTNFNAREVVQDIDQDGGNIDSDEELMRESIGTHEKTDNDISDDGTEDASLRTKKDHLIHANVDAMKIDDETGLDLFHEQNRSINFESLEAGGEVKGIVDENVDVLELPAFRRVPLDTDNAEFTSKTNTKMPSREDALNDKKIWEKIGERRAREHKGEEKLLESRLDENNGEESLLESRLDADKNNTQEVTEDSEEDIVKGNTGLLEKIRDEERFNDNSIEDDYFLNVSASNVAFEEVKDFETTEPIVVKEIETQTLVRSGSKNNEPIGEMHQVVIVAAGNHGNNFIPREVEELDLVVREVVEDIYKDGGNINSDEKVMRENMGTQKNTGSDISDGRTEDASLRLKKDHLIHANADAMELGDEYGLHLFDDQNISMNFESLEAGGEENESVVENVDVLAHPASGRVPLDTDNAEVSYKTSTKMPSKTDVLDDEKIWEKIGAMRAIEPIGEESLIQSRLDEYKVEGSWLESRLDDDKNRTQEVTKDSIEDIVRGSTELVESIRDKGRVNDNTVEDDYFSASNVLFKEVKEAEATKPVTVKEEIETQILVKGGSKNNEPIGQMHHVVILAAGNEENNFNSRDVEELDLVSRQGNIDSDEKVMRASMGIQEKTGSDISDEGTEAAASLRTKKDHLIHGNADAREIGDESGLDLFDDQKISMNFESLEAKEVAADENVDVLALPAFRRASLDTDNRTVTSETNAKTPSREDILDDEKIWEKIVAMRTIVGYNAPSQPTCMGELKALYVFTGVEPPASFKGDSDLDEVNAKLKFLMAIVGVK